MPDDASDSHNQYQRRYFETVERSRIAVGESPYVLAHVERVIAAAKLSPGHAILEVGSGLGRFTLPLVTRGYEVTASDLSPVLLERLRRATLGRVATACGDLHDIDRHVHGRFDRIVGFFVLHHLVDLDRAFLALARALRAGGRIAFCEPVAWSPLYYLQILMTPGMRFAGEPSLTSMRASVVLPALARAGFVGATCHPYGYFPPFLKNRPWGDRLERWLDARAWVPFPRSFQVFTARRAE